MNSHSSVDTTLGEEFERDLARVVERVRTMPLTRLATCADGIYGLCLALADIAQGAGAPSPGAVAVRRLGDHALPDQLQVLGNELSATGDPAAIGQAHALLVDMRKALP